MYFAVTSIRNIPATHLGLEILHSLFSSHSSKLCAVYGKPSQFLFGYLDLHMLDLPVLVVLLSNQAFRSLEAETFYSSGVSPEPFGVL